MSKHLTLTDRAIIEKYLAQDMSFSFIAKRLNRSATTISCEIKNHRCFVNGFRYTSNDCINYRSCLRRNICDQESIYTCSHRCKTCTEFDCKSLCSQYISAHCPLLDKPPYVCTRCPNEKTCKRNHAYYTAHRAHAEYVKELSSSRKGIRTSPERLLELNDLLMPLVNKGQSINHIFATHSDEILSLIHIWLMMIRSSSAMSMSPSNISWRMAQMFQTPCRLSLIHIFPAFFDLEDKQW